MKGLLQKVLGREALNNTIIGFADILSFEKKKEVSEKVIANERGFSHFTCKPLTHFCKFALLINKNFPLPQGAREEYFPSEASEKVLSPLTSHFSQANPPQPSLGKGGRKAAFTLAEVLITLGIIGVVAAITMPTLVANYQKHVLYNQFMKAASTIENAINAYNHEHGCGKILDQRIYDVEQDNLCIHSDRANYEEKTLKLAENIKVLKWLNEDNMEEVCAGYKKLPPTLRYDGSDRNPGDWSWVCSNDAGVTTYGFITNDGMLIVNGDKGNINGSIVDINGPDKGPNIAGRDIFVFYTGSKPGNRWTDWERPDILGCTETNNNGEHCGKRLLIEHKMNY